LRKLSVARPQFHARPDSPDFPQRLRTLLLNCPFRFELGLNAATSSGELADLHPGKILTLNKGTGDPAILAVDDRAIFTAHLACHGNRRLAHIVAPSEQTTEKGPL
jgi:flagellar motor switch protein FliM